MYDDEDIYMFTLPNNVTQVNFQHDQTKMVFNCRNQVVTHINIRGERKIYPLNNALEASNADMVKKLKQTDFLLRGMRDHCTYPYLTN